MLVGLEQIARDRLLFVPKRMRFDVAVCSACASPTTAGSAVGRSSAA